jgi:ATP-binding cassette subfamily B (MDR/TAP) protein 6
LELGLRVLLPIKADSTDPYDRVFAILNIPPSCLRLIFLPILIVLVLNPVIKFVSADERTGLLADTDADTEANAAAQDVAQGSSSTAPARNTLSPGYGTFNGGSSHSRETSTTTTDTGATPTPAAGDAKGAKINIPKKLGEKKEESQGISWKAFSARLWKLWPHLWPSTSWRLQVCCVLCVLFLLVGRAVNALVPQTIGVFVRTLTENQHGGIGPSPWPPLVFYIALRFMQSGGVLAFAQNVLWIPVQQYADREMQLLCFNHLLDLSLAFHTKRNTGEVLRIIDRGSAINNLFQTLLFNAAPTMLDIIIYSSIFFHLYGPFLSGFMVLTMTAYVTFSLVFTGYRTKLRREMVERDVKTRGIAADVLTNWESVKYFTAEARETRRFADSIRAYQVTESRVTVSFNLLNLVQSFIITLGLLMGSVIIAWQILNGPWDGKGQPDAASFIVFLMYIQQLMSPLDRLGTLYRQLNVNATDAEKLFTLLSQPTEIRDKPGAKELVVSDGVIEFDNVCFSYDKQVQALKNVSFRIGKGESMALVGESGSGKSTILRLLYRFYDIDSGVIRIDGQDISTVTQSSLRRAIGIVPQDSVLWNDTIGANISYGKEGADDDQIIAAALAAKLHERILSFPEGYATVVGERGVRLSGGEKQRVSLARMFLKSPAILVLDEATSALDTETEREIQKALAELAKGRSSLSIAHRLSTIINSDQIVVMKDGNVIEHGSYQELIEVGGQFSIM